MTEFTLTSMNGENEEFFLDEDSDSGWYIDSDGDLIFVLDGCDREEANVFAIVINGEGWGSGTAWAVSVDEIDSYLTNAPVRPLRKLDIKYAV